MATADKVIQIGNFTAPGQNSVPVVTGLLEAASQSFKAGAPVINSSGKVAILGTDGIASIIGFATHDASGTTDTATSIIPVYGGPIEFEANLENSSSGDYALTQADLFASYGLVKTSGGLWYIDQAETTHKSVVIVGLVDAVGTTQARVRARLIQAVVIQNVSTS